MKMSRNKYWLICPHNIICMNFLTRNFLMLSQLTCKPIQHVIYSKKIKFLQFAINSFNYIIIPTCQCSPAQMLCVTSIQISEDVLFPTNFKTKHTQLVTAFMGIVLFEIESSLLAGLVWNYSQIPFEQPSLGQWQGTTFIFSILCCVCCSFTTMICMDEIIWDESEIISDKLFKYVSMMSTKSYRYTFKYKSQSISVIKYCTLNAAVKSLK